MSRCQVLSVTGLILLTLSSLSEAGSASFKIVNNCQRTIWPGLLTNMMGQQVSQLSTTGFALKSGESNNISIPKPWTGRVWGRTHCVQDSSGKFMCLTGDCGALECGGVMGQAPVTMAEFGLASIGDTDFYDVSVVDGFNLPMLVEVKGPSGVCDTAGCLVDLNGGCPRMLSVLAGKQGSVGEVVACRNGCELDQFTTRSDDKISKCARKLYSKIFRSACPRAYTNPYDDKIGTLVCTSAEYIVTFCP